MPLGRSFPRKRESSYTIYAGRNWVPAFAGTSGIKFMGRIFLAIVALAFTTLATAQVAPLSRAPAIAPAQTVRAHSGVVTAQEQRAARIGTGILDRGGNAVDAAVATGFALAVTYPRAGNIGGGGFMVIHLAKDNRDTAIDYRETAPAAASSTMFLDAQGNADPAKSRDSALSVGIPGTVAGLAMAHEKYGSGKFTLADLIAPAIYLAQNGFQVEDDTADCCRSRASALRAGRRRSRFSSMATGLMAKVRGCSSLTSPTPYAPLRRTARAHFTRAALPTRLPPPSPRPEASSPKTIWQTIVRPNARSCVAAIAAMT